MVPCGGRLVAMAASLFFFSKEKDPWEKKKVFCPGNQKLRYASLLIGCS